MEFSQILETQSHMVDHFFIELAMGTYSAETDHISYIVGCMLITYSTVSLFVNQYIYIYITIIFCCHWYSYYHDCNDDDYSSCFLFSYLYISVSPLSLKF